MKRRIALLACLLACAFADAGETSTLLKTRLTSGKAARAGVWLSNFSKAKSYAVSKGIPMIAVWSNGDSCGHCVAFESACNSSYFKSWMKSSGCVFFFTHSGESQGSIGGTIFHWCRKNTQTSYPFVRIYWPKGKVDIAVVGDTVDGGQDGTTGGKKVAAYIKKKCSKFFAAKAAVKPYTIQFAPNGATNEMASVTAKVGTARTLPANTLIYPDYSFLGWAKAATGSVAYKNKASVKNLTTVSNGVVTLYAKWRRVVYRTYYTGLSATITMSELKGWTTSSKVAGMKWTSKTGKWTGKPTKAGTYTVKFKKGTSSTTRKIVVAKDAILFAEEDYGNRVIVPGEPFELDLSPVSAVGAVKSATVTGLPAGFSYAGGRITGTTTQVGTFAVKVTAISAKGQTLTRTLLFEIGVPDCCIGTFNGFIGTKDTMHQDELAFLNRGTFRLSAPSNANLSAKIVTAKGSYSFTGLGWTKNGDGTYTANLASSTGKDIVTFTVTDASQTLDDSFRQLGVFTPSYGTAYDIWAQHAPFARDASGKYLDETVETAMSKVVGTWYFKVYAVGSGAWQFDFATAKTANLTLTVSADGTTKMAGKIGSLKVSASSAVFVFSYDVAEGFVRADFAIPVTVSKTKKTLDVWTNLWFDKSSIHFNARNEGVGGAALETFK